MKLLRYSMLSESEQRAYQRHMSVILPVDRFTEGRADATEQQGGRSFVGGAVLGAGGWLAGSSAKLALEAYLRVLQSRHGCEGIDKASFPHGWEWSYPSAGER